MFGAISICKRFLQWMQPCNKSCLEIDVRLWRSFVTACYLSWVNNIVGQWEQHLRIFGYGYIIAGGNYAQPQHRNSSSVVFIPANKFIKYVRQSWVCLRNKNTCGATCFIWRMAKCQSRAPVLVVFDRTPWYELWCIVRCNLCDRSLCARAGYLSCLSLNMPCFMVGRPHVAMILTMGLSSKLQKKPLIGPPPATHSSIFFFEHIWERRLLLQGVRGKCNRQDTLISCSSRLLRKKTWNYEWLFV